MTQDQDSDGGRLPPGIILIRPLATRSIFSLIPTHKTTLWDTNLGNISGHETGNGGYSHGIYAVARHFSTLLQKDNFSKSQFKSLKVSHYFHGDVLPLFQHVLNPFSAFGGRPPSTFEKANVIGSPGLHCKGF